MPMREFDILEFVNHAKRGGIDVEFAEYTARQINHLAENIHHQLRHPVTKHDINELEMTLKKEMLGLELRIQKEINESKLQLQKEIEGVKRETIEIKSCLQKEIEGVRKEIMNTKIQTLLWIGVNTAFMLGIMAKGFHWF